MEAKITSNDRYSCNIFLNSVLPLVKVIVESNEKLESRFIGKNAKVQVSARDDAGKVGTYFVIENGKWNVFKGTTAEPDVELEFKNIPALNNFFSGKSKRLPKIRGVKNIGLLIGTFKALMAMSKLLGSKKPPVEEKDKALLVKLYFYLLSSGISVLNKCGHPQISKWAGKSPDRVYAWAVNGKPELSAHIRVKAGNTKSVHGEYKRAKPFFTMRFDSVDSALGTLLETDDFINATVNGRLIMDGAPEFGAEIGAFMGLVGSYVK